MNRPMGTEKPRLWKTTNNTTYPLGAWHGLVDGDDPLNDVGEGRKPARLDQTEELLAGDVGARPVRHHDGEVLGELEAQAATVLWMWKNLERKGQAREEEEADGKAKSRNSARRAVLKGAA
jgi:hypothetical protein